MYGNFLPNETSAFKTGLRVKVENNDVVAAYAKLRRIMRDEGLINDLQAARFFESKGQKVRRRKKEAVRRQKRIDEKNKWFF